LETDAGLLDDMGLQSLFNKKVASTTEIFSLIDSVSAGDLNSVS
jgi:hypothetical protein